eukprot:1180866-Prorocentrum_minimum.AAC.1
MSDAVQGAGAEGDSELRRVVLKRLEAAQKSLEKDAKGKEVDARRSTRTQSPYRATLLSTRRVQSSRNVCGCRKRAEDEKPPLSPEDPN